MNIARIDKNYEKSKFNMLKVNKSEIIEYKLKEMPNASLLQRPYQ